MNNYNNQADIDQKNSTFWDELCGTQLAKSLGVVDSSQESLAKFDSFYLNYYPYLKKYLCLDELNGKNVLEVGLGYGTVSQLLALSGATYHGLDIAPNAVGMVNHRLQQHHLEGDVRVNSMLTCPFPDDYFDYVFSIGCFHHTGDMQACVNQTRRILKPGGKAIIMVYNQFSLRQWMCWPRLTVKNLLLQLTQKHNKKSNESQRKAYDCSASGSGAPETEFFSITELQTIFSKYNAIHVTRENMDEKVITLKLGKIPLVRFGNRAQYLDSRLTRQLGLDLYIEAIK
ncbi:class I SAM-dependent methyltransferase [bacterium]|nr:class I SAM-dependent methyltransferase [bacterium]